MTRPSSDYTCPLCQDQEGQFYRDANNLEYWRDCECVLKRRSERLIQSSKITQEFQKKSFGNFSREGKAEVIKQAFDSAYQYVLDFNRIRNDRHNSIALLGNPGSGKTHLLMAISNNLIKRGVEVIYFPWVEGFNELKDDFKRLDERVRRLQHAEVLYIDDMFKGREPTPLQKEQLFAIINFRYLEHKPILISSERDIAEMCEIDEGIGSRINEMCREYKVILNGGIELNYRLQ